MKAVVYHDYGSPDVLKLEEVQKPVPRDNEVLVRVHAAALNAGDWHVLRGELLHRLVGTGLLKPKRKILGDDIAGRVEAVGRNVTQFQPGDEVFGTCNYGAFRPRCRSAPLPAGQKAVRGARSQVAMKPSATTPELTR